MYIKILFIACPYPCGKCDSNNICIECATSLNRGLPVDCICDDNYFDNGSNC